MLLIKMLLCCMTVWNYNASVEPFVVITGKAENAKAGAVVISSQDMKIFYLDGVAAWDSNTVGKMVRVSGKKVVEKQMVMDPNGPVEQGMSGVKRTIMKPKWELSD